MTAWFDGRLCAVDCETTGVDPEQDRIVQVAVWYVGGDQERSGFTQLVNPGVPIPESASAVHGITDAGVKAPDVLAGDAAARRIALEIGAAVEVGYPLVAFNARFDLTMIDRECRRHGVAVPLWEDARVIDPHVIDKWLHRFRKGSRRLSAVCEHYDVKLDDAHDAGADALAAARLAWVLATRANFEARHPEVIAGRTEWKRLRGDLDALHAAQVGWAREQAEGLAAHFRSQGREEDAASVRTEWPIVPLSASAPQPSASELLTPEWTT